MPIVHPQNSPAVAEDVGCAGHEHDAPLTEGEGLDERGFLGEGEGGGGVDAALLWGGGGGVGAGECVESLDFAFVAFDDGEVASGEELYDGVATDGCGAGAAIVKEVYVSVKESEKQQQVLHAV
jgi:hypothetical protein